MDFENNTDKFLKIGELKAIIHKIFEEELKTDTISKYCKGKYYFSILVEDGKEVPVKQVFSESTTICVDVGIKDFAFI